MAKITNHQYKQLSEVHDKLPKELRSQMEHDVHQLIQTKKRLEQIQETINEFEKKVTSLKDDKSKVRYKEYKLLRKKYNLSGYVPVDIQERRLKLLEEKAIDRIDQAANTVPTIKRIEIETAYANNERKREWYVKAYIAGPSTDTNYTSGKKSILDKLAMLGIFPYVSAIVSCKLKMNSNGNIYIARDFSSRQNWDYYFEDNEFALGTLPNPHLYQYSCLGDWVQHIFKGHDASLEQGFYWLSYASRAIDYDEDAQQMYICDCDIDLINQWTIVDKETKVKTDFTGNIHDLLKRYIAPEDLIKACERCNTKYVNCKDSDNPLSRFKSGKRCCSDCIHCEEKHEEENYDRYDRRAKYRCECCELYKYFKREGIDNEVSC